MKINVKVKVTNNFPRVKNATSKTLGDALYMVAEEVMTDSKINYVPVVTGKLMKSGFVREPVYTPTQIKVVLGYNTTYALAVHDRPIAIGQGKNKYLSKPINSASKDLAKRIRAKMRAIMGTP